MLMREALSLDLHPGGAQCAVGFREGLKIFFISDGEFREAFESFHK